MGARTWIKKSYILVEKKVGIKISQISYRGYKMSVLLLDKLN
jgi:hypothetical protein